MWLFAVEGSGIESNYSWTLLSKVFKVAGRLVDS